MRKLILIILLSIVSVSIEAQNFTYSGYIKNADGSGAVNFPVKLYKRTTPVLTGFTSQTNYNGHSYYRSVAASTWTVAKTACEAMGGHLVTMSNSAENNFVYSQWSSGWIGLSDHLVEGQWKWVTGEAFSYSNWNSGEPNNAGDEDYIQFVGGGKWNDLPNNYSYQYVIEFDYIVTTTPWVLFQTVYTNSSGYYSFNQSTTPATEWYIQVDAIDPTSTLQVLDMSGVSNIVLGITPRKSIHWHVYDVNGDGAITISDAYYINRKRTGLSSSWIGSSSSKLFTAAQYTTISTGTTDTRSTYPGVSSFTITSPVSGGTSNYYIIAPGYKGQVTY